MIFLEKCNYCGALFIKKGNANRYCCKDCKHEAKLESKRKYINKRNTRKTYNTRIKNLTTLGSMGTSCSYHRKPSFEEEYRSIRSEMKMLKL